MGGRVAQVVLDLGARFQSRVNLTTTNPASNPPNMGRVAQVVRDLGARFRQRASLTTTNPASIPPTDGWTGGPGRTRPGGTISATSKSYDNQPRRVAQHCGTGFQPVRCGRLRQDQNNECLSIQAVDGEVAVGVGVAGEDPGK